MRAKGGALSGKTHEQRRIEKLFDNLIESPRKRFPKPHQALRETKEKGVYIIFNSKMRILHVGSTPRADEGITQRLKNHLAGQSSFVDYYLEGKREKIRRFFYRCLEVDKSRDRALVESYAIGRLCPAHLGGESFLRNKKFRKTLDRKQT